MTFFLRHVLPGLFLGEILGEKPMRIKPVEKPVIRAKPSRLPDWPAMDWICMPKAPHEVLFPNTHPIRDNTAEVIMWAHMNCHGLFRYMKVTFRLGDDPGWLWEFMDENDAFHFKVRWL